MRYAAQPNTSKRMLVLTLAETSQWLFDYSTSCADDHMTICAPERIFSDLKLPGDDPLNEGSIRQISS
jgi:hypothetical protein